MAASVSGLVKTAGDQDYFSQILGSTSMYPSVVNERRTALLKVQRPDNEIDIKGGEGDNVG